MNFTPVVIYLLLTVTEIIHSSKLTPITPAQNVTVFSHCLVRLSFCMVYLTESSDDGYARRSPQALMRELNSQLSSPAGRFVSNPNYNATRALVLYNFEWEQS